MKKDKMTKAERLAAYKAEKAAAKLLKEQHSLLADYLANNGEVMVTCMNAAYHHDCSLFSKDMKKQETLEQRVKMLYGETKFFCHAPGRFTFDVGDFFHYMKNSNPHLGMVVPKVLMSLYLEGMIDFSLREKKDDYEIPYAIFDIKRL